jgi:hypothetical protein
MTQIFRVLNFERTHLRFEASVASYCNVVPISFILIILFMEAIRFSETSVLTRTKRRNFQEDGILLNHLCENLKSYIKSYSLNKIGLGI